MITTLIITSILGISLYFINKYHYFVHPQWETKVIKDNIEIAVFSYMISHSSAKNHLLAVDGQDPDNYVLQKFNGMNNIRPISKSILDHQVWADRLNIHMTKLKWRNPNTAIVEGSSLFPGAGKHGTYMAIRSESNWTISYTDSGIRF